MFLIHTLPQQVWTVLMIGVTVFAFWRGGWPERTVAVGMIADSVASGILQDRHNWATTQWGDLAVDVAYLLLLVWVALKSDRLWPLWAAAFQLVGVVIYLARIVDMKVGALAPFTAVVIWSYLVLLSVVVGTWQRWRDRRPAPSPPAEGSAMHRHS